MIEGNLSDVSLPGLLQFLATESNKSYKISLVSGGQKAEVYVCAGQILSANYGLLEGNDALTELLFWPEGSFSVSLLGAEDIDGLKGNLTIELKQVNTFADQMVFLREAAVGLNSELVPSLAFGTQAWQEALAKQPLFKEDYAVLGWITDGRTMRQAMREFSFDVVRATSSLFRLLSTGSVEILRPTLEAEEEGGELPLTGLAAILENMQPGDEVEETFDASPEAENVKGGATAEAKAEVPAEAEAGGADRAEVKAEVKAEAAPAPGTEAKAEVKAEAGVESQSAASIETEANPFVVGATDGGDVAGNAGDKIETDKKDTVNENLSVAIAVPEPATIASSRLVKNSEVKPQSSVGTATGATFNAVGGTMELSMPAASADTAAALSDFNRVEGKLDYGYDHQAKTETKSTGVSKPENGRAREVEAPRELGIDVITSDSLPAVGSSEFNEIMAKAQKASEEPVDPSAPHSQAVTAQIHLPTSFRTSSDKLPVVTASLTPENVPIATAAAMARQTIDMDVPKSQISTAPKVPVVDSASAWAAAVRAEAPTAAPIVQDESPEKRLFDIVRTDPLPIVAIDIERLFQTSFHVSPYGHVSLSNEALDADLQKILMDFKMGKSFITVATEEHMLPAQVLHYCKYCLERGYIDPPDAVASLTADLLLGRVELEQYLLQRRRITGDELRDCIEVARQKGIKLTDLLVKLGFMTASDWDRLCQEKERFARR